MKVFRRLPPVLLGPLEAFRRSLLRRHILHALHPLIETDAAARGLSEAIGGLASMDYDRHTGAPDSWRCVNVNYMNLVKKAHLLENGVLAAIRTMNRRLDDDIQTFLGARKCVLKSYYPSDGYVGWHTNWNSPGYNMIFTYSRRGRGWWQHIDPTDGTAAASASEALVRIPDGAGWHCKAGYFGARGDVQRVIWHMAFTHEPRLTVAYIFDHERPWADLVRELEEYEAGPETGRTSGEAGVAPGGAKDGGRSRAETHRDRVAPDDEGTKAARSRERKPQASTLRDEVWAAEKERLYAAKARAFDVADASRAADQHFARAIRKAETVDDVRNLLHQLTAKP